MVISTFLQGKLALLVPVSSAVEQHLPKVPVLLLLEPLRAGGFTMRLHLKAQKVLMLLEEKLRSKYLANVPFCNFNVELMHDE